MAPLAADVLGSLALVSLRDRSGACHTSAWYRSLGYRVEAGTLKGAGRSLRAYRVHPASEPHLQTLRSPTGLFYQFEATSGSEGAALLPPPPPLPRANSKLPGRRRMG